MNEISTFIASKSGSDTIIDTLDSLSSCNLPSNYGKTVVIENGGPPSNLSYISKYKYDISIDYIHVSEKGKSRALNEALRATDDGLIFFADDDIRFDENVLLAYQEAGRKYGTGYFFGGPFNIEYETPPPEWLEDYLPPSAKGCWYDQDDVHDSFTGFLGFNWAAFTSDLKRAGGFNTRMGPGSPTESTGDENDMQRRLVESGTEARFVSDAQVTHLVPKENCSPAWALQRSLRNGVKDGLNYVREERHESRIPPLWLIKANAKWILRTIYNLQDSYKYFDCKFRLFYHFGFFKGVFMAQ